MSNDSQVVRSTVVKEAVPASDDAEIAVGTLEDGMVVLRTGTRSTNLLPREARALAAALINHVGPTDLKECGDGPLQEGDVDPHELADQLREGDPFVDDGDVKYHVVHQDVEPEALVDEIEQRARDGDDDE